jgi:glycosyltransferase involved in cell wall biosynthesis
MAIIYCMMCQNNLHEVRDCISRALPYVDHIIVVDGGSVDDSIFYFRNWSQQEPKLHFYIHPWTDQFSEQRTKYLRHADEFAKPGDWILVSDPDELFEEQTFQKLPLLIEAIQKKGDYNAAGFQCRSVSLKGPHRVWESLDNYWKHLFYRWEPNLRYIGQPHETLLISGGLRIVNTPLLYEHIKQENVIWKRGARNLFVGGGGPNLGDKNPRWTELKNACKSLGIETWHQFNGAMLKGNIPQPIRDWMIKYHDIDGFDGASEHREVYKTYYRYYHPEEEPGELRGKHIP